MNQANSPETWTYVRLRDGRIGVVCSKGYFSRVRTGFAWDENEKPEGIVWNLEGRWRWDGQDHPLDIVEGFQQT